MPVADGFSEPPKNAVRSAGVVDHARCSTGSRAARARSAATGRRRRTSRSTGSACLTSVVGAGDARVGLRNTGDLRQRRVELVEGAQADVGFRPAASAGGGRRRHRRIGGTCACGADLLEGQEEQVVEHALLEADDRADGRHLLAGAGGVARAADGRRSAATYAWPACASAPFTPMRTPSIGRFATVRVRIEADEGRLGELQAVAVELAGLEHHVRLRHGRPGG